MVARVVIYSTRSYAIETLEFNTAMTLKQWRISGSDNKKIACFIIIFNLYHFNGSDRLKFLQVIPFKVGIFSVILTGYGVLDFRFSR